MRKKTRKPLDRIELNVDSMAFLGVGVAKIDGYVYFVNGAVPGDVVLAEITKKKQSFSEARVVEILKPSDKRIKPPCKHFGVCGGCSWQSLDYSEQMHWKAVHVADSIERIGKITSAEILPALGSPKIFNYRNKMEFSFGYSRWLTSEEIALGDEDLRRDFALGLHIPGRYDKILEIEHCLLQSEIGNRILKAVHDKTIEMSLTAYNSHSRSGFLRNLVIRSSVAFDETMAVLVSSPPETRAEREFIDWFMDEMPKGMPGLAAVLHAQNDTSSPVAQGEIKRVTGKDFISERILDVVYRVSPFSFFQTNSYQLDNFIGKILEFARLGENDVVWDLYCGAGSITLPTSRRVKEIYGIEIFDGAIRDAIANAAANGIENAHLICHDLHAKSANGLLAELPRPDVIIVDPPRAGMHRNLVDILLETKPKRIVYVSCNPTTQARDCELLAEKYRVETVLPVDMFPHTYHIESIARLELLPEAES